MHLQKLYFLKKLSLIILISLLVIPLPLGGLVAGAGSSGSEGFLAFVIFVAIVVILLFLFIAIKFIIQTYKFSKIYPNLNPVFILSLIAILAFLMFPVSFVCWIVACAMGYSRVSTIINYEEKRETEFID